MYLKITGIVLIMMSASLMGYLFSKDYIERINRLEQIQKMLILLKGEISYSNNSVQEALENLMRNRTTIVIAHRLSTIKDAHKIYVMHEGEIVESGTHSELMALNKYYKKLVDMQKV